MGIRLSFAWYIVVMVFHEQSNSIEEPMEYLERRKTFNKMVTFTRQSGIKYKTFYIEKKHMGNFMQKRQEDINMKKNGLYSIVVTFLLFSLTGCTNSTTSHIQKIADEYDSLCEKMETDSDMTDVDLYSTYANLCNEIAKGNQGQKAEYAQLLEKIMKNEIEVSEEDVFELAADYASIYEEMATGNDDFGVQDIFLANNGEILTVSYKADVRAYSVEVIDEYNLKITFYDANPSNSFLNKYSFGTVYALTDTLATSNRAVEFKCEYNADHGFFVYVTSSETLDVVEQPITELERPLGKIEITLYY